MMMNRITKLLLGIALIFTTSVAYTEPVEYTFSTTGTGFIDPLLAGLTSVSGSFIYETDAPLIETNSAGFSVYRAWSSLSGSTNGYSFSAPVAQVIVGNDRFDDNSGNLQDFFLLATDTGQFLTGFTFAGMELEAVFLVWIEGQNGIGDFLDDQSLSSVLPPTIAGGLEMDFVDSDGATHRAFYNLSVVSAGPAVTGSISFQGQLDFIDADNGNAIYSGALIGTNFWGEIDLVTGLSSISDGITTISGSISLVDGTASEDGSFVDYINDITIEAEDASFVNAFQGSNFEAGDVVDFLQFESDAITQNGTLIAYGLKYILDPLSFDVDSPNKFPPNPDDILLTYFTISEDDSEVEDFYFAAGTVSQISITPVIPKQAPASKAVVSSLAVETMFTTILTHDGSETTAEFTAGASADGGQTVGNEFTNTEDVLVAGGITPQAEDVGKDGGIFVVLRTVDSTGASTWSNLNAAGQFVSWNGTIAFLVAAYDRNPLLALDSVVIFNGKLPVGDHRFFIGYQLDVTDSPMHYTGVPLRIIVTE